jgi:putative DNA primase/helicase
MTLTDYARLAFNCNELPKDVEHSEAFFRRFLIIEFDQTIPKNERNPNLAKEIIESELPGVFNWVLEGVERLLRQQQFSPCSAIDKTLERYRFESDSVAMFLEEEGYKTNTSAKVAVKDVYAEYKSYCQDNSYKPLGRNNFTKRLERNKVQVHRANIGSIALLERRK